jgi:hypothetical protein
MHRTFLIIESSPFAVRARGFPQSHPMLGIGPRAGTPATAVTGADRSGADDPAVQEQMICRRTGRRLKLCMRAAAHAKEQPVNELVDVIATWFDGHSTASMVVWGRPILVWGRVGQVMLYFAALSIVLDLLDPHKLRMRGGELKVCATYRPCIC